MPAKNSTKNPARKSAQQKVSFVRGAIEAPRIEAQPPIMQIPGGEVISTGHDCEAVMVPMSGRRGYILITRFDDGGKPPRASDTVVDVCVYHRHHWTPAATYHSIPVADLLAKLPQLRGGTPRDAECEIGLTDTILHALRMALGEAHEDMRRGSPAPKGAHALHAHYFRAAIIAISSGHASVSIRKDGEDLLQIPGASLKGGDWPTLVVRTRTGRFIVISDDEGRAPTLDDEELLVCIYAKADSSWSNPLETYNGMTVEDLLSRLPDWEAT